VNWTCEIRRRGRAIKLRGNEFNKRYTSLNIITFVSLREGEIGGTCSMSGCCGVCTQEYNL
jgi:hypothetical protein